LKTILEWRIRLIFKLKDLKEQEKVHEKQQFHLDTMNMMTKYQIVFLKLETSIKKIVSNNEWRNELRKRRGFMKLTENAIRAKLVSEKTNQLINAKTERVCNNLSSIANKCNFKVARALDIWKLHTEYQKKEQRVFNVKNKKLKAVNNDIEKGMKKLESLTKKKDNDLESLKQRIQEHNDHIKQLEQQKQSLECEYVMKQIQNIESENTELKTKIDSSQDNVGSFISDMNSILETHDFQALLEGTDLFDQFNMGTEEFDDAQQHAGTGGSSKIKSRPSRRRQNR
jgi:hypothetical protein